MSQYPTTNSHRSYPTIRKLNITNRTENKNKQETNFQGQAFNQMLTKYIEPN